MNFAIEKLDYNYFNNYQNELYECIKELKHNDSNSSKELLKNMETFLKDESAIIYVSICDNKLTGFLWSYFIAENKMHINYFVVLSNYRNRGLGRAIMQKFLDDNKKNVIELLVYRSNINAIYLYEKFGFKKESYSDEKYKMIFEGGSNGEGCLF